MGYLESTLLPARPDDVLEMDEVWTFVGNKHNRVWIWLALCRRTRQIVAWWYGSRDALDCKMLRRKIPESYRHCFCYSDQWDAYGKVLLPGQHQACAKQEGQTNHIERFNLTLRQSVARLVRKTLSFSKQLLPHLRALRHFLVQYNRRKAKEYHRARAKLALSASPH
jgi:insertion element IS1 protein InsB